MAQDFYAAFGVGEDDKHITSIDEDGVALAAIKALHAEERATARAGAQGAAGVQGGNAFAVGRDRRVTRGNGVGPRRDSVDPVRFCNPGTGTSNRRAPGRVRMACAS